MRPILLGIAIGLALTLMPLWLVIDLWELAENITRDIVLFQLGAIFTACAVGFVLMVCYEFVPWVRQRLRVWFH